MLATPTKRSLTLVEGGLRYFYATSEDESNPLARARLRGLDKRLLNQNTVRQLEMSEAKACIEIISAALERLTFSQGFRGEYSKSMNIRGKCMYY